jgi:hypothetical protein
VPHYEKSPPTHIKEDQMSSQNTNVLVLFQKLGLKYKTPGDTNCSNDNLDWRKETKAPEKLNPVFLW